ncbi:MAG: CYTH domain-containing protein, partial [Candidatus Ranarchaeia archaeon]
MVIETEIKLSLSERDIQAIENRIIEKGFRFIKEVSLEDIYFDTVPSIFDEKKVVKLRIEENNEKKKTSELTFKGSVSTKSLA